MRMRDACVAFVLTMATLRSAVPVFSCPPSASPDTVRKVIFLGGPHFTEEDLRELTGVKPGLPNNPDLNKIACNKIVTRCHELGRAFATCELLKGADRGDTEVVFHITEGPKVAVRSIRFAGNTFVGSEVLDTHISSSRKCLRLYNSLLVEADIKKLQEYYKSCGFLDVCVSSELISTPDGEDVDLVFHIREGMRQNVNGTQKTYGPKTIPVEELEQIIKVKPGQFGDQDIDRDVNFQKDYIGNYEDRDAKVLPGVSFDKNNPTVVTVQYEVTEMPPAKVGQIFILGNTRTKQNVILRQVPLYPGQVLTYPALKIAEKNLARLGLFVDDPRTGVHPVVKVLDADGKSEFKDILIEVQEKPQTDRERR
jgi:outer membrane protein insertion porin family